jgi:hypothetical protein
MVEIAQLPLTHVLRPPYCGPCRNGLIVASVSCPSLSGPRLRQDNIIMPNTHLPLWPRPPGGPLVIMPPPPDHRLARVTFIEAAHMCIPVVPLASTPAIDTLGIVGRSWKAHCDIWRGCTSLSGSGDKGMTTVQRQACVSLSHVGPARHSVHSVQYAPLWRLHGPPVQVR